MAFIAHSPFCPIHTKPTLIAIEKFPGFEALFGHRGRLSPSDARLSTERAWQGHTFSSNFAPCPQKNVLPDRRTSRDDLVDLDLVARGSPGSARPNTASGRIFAFGKSHLEDADPWRSPGGIRARGSSDHQQRPSAESPDLPVAGPGDPLRLSPEIAKFAVLIAPKYFSNTALFSSPCTHQSVIERRAQQINVAASRSHEAFVPRAHPLHGLRARRPIEARGRRRHQRRTPRRSLRRRLVGRNHLRQLIVDLRDLCLSGHRDWAAPARRDDRPAEAPAATRHGRRLLFAASGR
jgi:hypothetical protein